MLGSVPDPDCSLTSLLRPWFSGVQPHLPHHWPREAWGEAGWYPHLQELEVREASRHPGQLVVVQMQLTEAGQEAQAPVLNHANLVVAQTQPVEGGGRAG